jgi:hypothetical protein
VPGLGSLRQMKIWISDARLLPSLLTFLSVRSDLVVERLNDQEVEASVVGSFGEKAHRRQLELLLQAWRAAHPAAEAKLMQGD